jgi:FdhE protein
MTPAPGATRESRLAAAASRWQAILAARPELAPAVALQQQLITLVVDLTETLERATIPLPVPVMTPALLSLCDELGRGGAGEAAEHIKASILETRMDAASLLVASFTRDQEAIRTGATHRGLSPDLVWLLAELAVSPYMHVLQSALLSPTSGEPALAAALADWSHGYCAACGSWPALAEIHESHRVLRCSFCARPWELKTFSCVYCGTAGERFVIFAGSADRPDRRIEICGGCGGYLKTVDVPELSPFPLLAIADLETMDLDMMAMEKGYRRPGLKDFKKKG